jgi:hypothetical protein
LGFLASKWFVFRSDYFGLGALLLTRNEEKAKGGEKRVQGVGCRG